MYIRNIILYIYILLFPCCFFHDTAGVASTSLPLASSGRRRRRCGRCGRCGRRRRRRRRWSRRGQGQRGQGLPALGSMARWVLRCVTVTVTSKKWRCWKIRNYKGLQPSDMGISISLSTTARRGVTEMMVSGG